MVIVQPHRDLVSLSSELFTSALSYDGQAGVLDGDYIVAFEVHKLENDTYSFTDFLLDKESETVVAIDEDTSGEDYSEEDVHMLILNRLEQVDVLDN